MNIPRLDFRQQLRLRENQIFLILAVMIGILSGLAAVLFTLSIKATTYCYLAFHLRRCGF